MKRRLFNFTAVVSLLLCVATVVLWVRSQSHVDILDITGSHPGHSRFVLLNSGATGLKFALIWEGRTTKASAEGDEAASSTPWKVEYESAPVGSPDAMDWPQETFWNRLGFWWHAGRVDFSDTYRRWLWIGVPHWSLALLFAFSPCYGFILYRHRKRQGNHVCGQCGYDLRATPSRCPECGAVP